MWRSALVFGVLLLLAHSTWAQERTPVTIRSADKLRGIRTDSTEIQIAIGHVSFEQKGTILNCDSALLFQAYNRVLAYGNVEILQGDTLDIQSDALRYDGNQDLATLNGNVRLQQQGMTLTTPSLTYNMATKQAQYTNGATIQNDSTTLSSIIGYYYSNSRIAYFKEVVRLVNKRYTLSSDTLEYHTATKVAFFHGPTTITSKENTIYCEGGWYDTEQEQAKFTTNAWLDNPPQRLAADTIYYERDNGFGRATNNIVFQDTAQAILLFSDAAEYFEAQQTVHATKDPTVVNIIDNDSLFIAADTLRSIEDSVRSYLMAYPNVSIFKRDLQGRCDSLAYDRSDSVLTLFHDPIMWSDSNQFTADTIRILYRAKGIDRVELRQQSFMASLKDTLVYDQIKGRDIDGYFRLDSLRRLEVNGNGEAIYYAQDDSLAYLGVNKVQSSRITIRIQNNTVDKINFRGSPDAQLDPIQDINPGNFILEGFQWYGDLRPTRPQFRPYRKNKVAAQAMRHQD